ncbi:MAG TPA: cupredoxin domain-containing protein [Gaiellaceae bacterium]|nr:cupredoxin domain-containing protein [Gaiellaceae bacterium]
MKLRLTLVLAAAVPVLATGCGGVHLGKPVATNEVLLPRSYKFEPAAIVVKAGTSVTWRNDDNFSHTVKVEHGADHKLARGESVTIRFAKPGTYHYLCTLHSHDMRGEVIVE